MSLQTIIQVGLGLILAWLLLSMIVMYVQEWIVSRLSLRSTMLEMTIYNMLTEPAIAAQFYDHPLIKGLYSEQGKSKPSYIPSQQFVLALFDIVMNAGKESSLLQQEVYKLRGEIDRLSKDDKARAEAQYNLALTAARQALATNIGEAAVNQALDNVKAKMSELAAFSPSLKTAVDQALQNVQVNKQEVNLVLAELQAQSAGLSENPTLEQVRVGIATLAVTQPQLKQALETLLQGVEEYAVKGESALSTARVSVEKWFDDSMDRLSGWYRRKSQQLAFFIGIAVVIFLNGDTVLLAQQLWRDPGLRLSLVAQAQNLIEQQPEDATQPTVEQITELQAQFSSLNVPFGWVGTPIPLDPNGRIPGMDDTSHACTLAPATADDVFGFAVAGQCYPIINAPHFNDLTGWVLKLFGLIVSGMAAAQGAPFWFDILKRFINIRASGANPSEAKPAG